MWPNVPPPRSAESTVLEVSRPLLTEPGLFLPLHAVEKSDHDSREADSKELMHAR